MKYCPNKECPFLREEGMVAEYRDDIERCADCGSKLVSAAPRGLVVVGEAARQRTVAHRWNDVLAGAAGGAIGAVLSTAAEIGPHVASRPNTDSTEIAFGVGIILMVYFPMVLVGSCLLGGAVGWAAARRARRWGLSGWVPTFSAVLAGMPWAFFAYNLLWAL